LAGLFLCPFILKNTTYLLPKRHAASIVGDDDREVVPRIELHLFAQNALCKNCHPGNEVKKNPIWMTMVFALNIKSVSMNTRQGHMPHAVLIASQRTIEPGDWYGACGKTLVRGDSFKGYPAYQYAFHALV
jgi:hypothetical protein